MTGRVNQKARTRAAIVEAARTLVASGAEISMPAVARRALVSEATAYRYFPDLASLLREAVAGAFPRPEEALAPVAHSTDLVERVGFATEFLLRTTLAHEAAVRAMIAASIAQPAVAAARPVNRFGLIDTALAPVPGLDPRRALELRRGLAVVMSAEALFTLIDLAGLSPDEAVASAVTTARTLAAAALGTRRPPAARARR